MDNQNYAVAQVEVLAALEGGREVISRLKSMGWTLKAGKRGQLVPMQVVALAGSLASPSEFWARAAVGTLEGLNIEDQAALVSSSIPFQRRNVNLYGDGCVFWTITAVNVWPVLFNR